MKPALIELRGIRRRYGGQGPGEAATEVLRGIDLDIRDGEFVAIVGASGSGKSTLMHILGCLDPATAGSYRFEGRDVATLDADGLARLRREAFGFVFQGYHLIPTESASENVQIPARYAGRPASWRSARARALLARLGLADRLSHRPRQLSGGQQQRVCIARALMNGGRVILADEPTGALDSASGAEVMALLQELAAAGHTIVLITHDPGVAACARRVVHMRDGRIVGDTGGGGPAPGHLPEPAQAAPGVAAPEPAAPMQVASAWTELIESLRSAGRVMRLNRLRTALTLLGVIIGVASVIVMLAVVRGSQQAVLAQMDTFGTRTVFVFPRWISERQRPRPLRLADAEAIRRLPHVEQASPYAEQTMLVRRGSADFSSRIGGTTQGFTRALNWPAASGALLPNEDEHDLSKVAVIGETVRRHLFGDGVQAVGADILIDKVPFRVIGVLAPKGQTGGQDMDDRIIVPLGAARARLFGSFDLERIDVVIRDMAHAAETEAAIVRTLAALRGGHDFETRNQAQEIRARAQADSTLTLMLGLIAAISLLVGGIGVMNVMLMTVRERVREIGICMAVGARQGDILRQFLVEAVLLTGLGGTAGVASGLAIGALLMLAGVPVSFSAVAVTAALGCAVATGLVFGFMPARQAARLAPVAALSGP
ncbi:ABC transporter permease [Delftia sp. PS-11]|uniref:ABC transporter permease n=1 Tax=Delftia sp. PS-11 TaxID=2767222 RepID=UPI0024577FD8|nr:ABC transporter permease [Delftia sp. PS-11]KAJ8743104.1 ABC transporter permease [Delftia sp. PS-11]